VSLRQCSALFLVWLTACSTTPRVLPLGEEELPDDEAGLTAARYELRELSADSGPEEGVELSREDFQRAVRKAAADIVPISQPLPTVQWLMEGQLRADLRAEVDRGQVVRLWPLEEGSPLQVGSASEVKRHYREWCQRDYQGHDFLGLFSDGPELTKEDIRTLGLALALKPVLSETRDALQGMVSPEAIIGMIVSAAAVYFALWLLPEPVTKFLAAGLTLALLAWLPVHTLWELMDGWAQFVHEVDRATTYEQIEEASKRFSKLMGENTARVLVLLITTALGGGGAKFVSKLRKLPGFAQATARAEAQGVSLSVAGDVEAVAAAEGRTFTLMVRRPGGRSAAAADEAAEARAGITTIIRHLGGNRQVFINGQRWHLRAGQSLKDIPLRDPIGDALQAAARRIAKTWNRDHLSFEQAEAIRRTRDRGEYLKAHLMERRFRGQWVENMMREEFKHLQWSRTGVDVVDPATGLSYEILAGTHSNMALHGRRMADVFFRLITF
jgi:hypothetical protein